jgi:hypothetical protein
LSENGSAVVAVAGRQKKKNKELLMGTSENLFHDKLKLILFDQETSFWRLSELGRMFRFCVLPEGFGCSGDI